MSETYVYAAWMTIKSFLSYASEIMLLWVVHMWPDLSYLYISQNNLTICPLSTLCATSNIPVHLMFLKQTIPIPTKPLKLKPHSWSPLPSDICLSLSHLPCPLLKAALSMRASPYYPISISTFSTQSLPPISLINYV